MLPLVSKQRVMLRRDRNPVRDAVKPTAIYILDARDIDTTTAYSIQASRMAAVLLRHT